MEKTLDQALQKGIEAHKAGQFQKADRLYTAILKAQPKHPDANHNMGVLAVGVNKVQEAIPFFKTALEANPSTAQFWFSYIDALIKLDQMPDAKAVLEQAKGNGAKGEPFDKLEQHLQGIDPTVSITANTQDPPQEQLQTIINLYNQGQLQKALDEASKLLQQFPNSVILHNIFGASNKGLGQLNTAIDSFKQAIKISPGHADTHYNIGNALQDKGKLEEAIGAYNKALSLKPEHAEAYNNMGVALQDQGKLEEATEAFNKALTIKPDYTEAV
jgi:tetratricopeptide (TPR) repeat protein